MSFIYFLKAEDIKSIGKKFILIYILNVSDILFTLLLLNTGLFEEGNTFMKTITDSNILSIIIKIAVPMILLIFIYVRMQKATAKQLHISNIITTVCLAFYFLINISHLIWGTVYLLIVC